jgi:dTDP-4-amino-4,6-dideoxygalactose transaminase
VVEQACEQILSLPLHPYLTAAQADLVIAALCEFLT